MLSEPDLKVGMMQNVLLGQLDEFSEYKTKRNINIKQNADNVTWQYM